MPLLSCLILSSRACLCWALLCSSPRCLARSRQFSPPLEGRQGPRRPPLARAACDSSGHLLFWFLGQKSRSHPLTCVFIPCSASFGGESFSRGSCGTGSHFHGPGGGIERSGYVFVTRDSEHLLVTRGGASVDYRLGLLGPALGLGLDALEAAQEQVLFSGRSSPHVPEA